MNIEDQVCSLELAKKLKELGVEQDSVWYWVKNDASRIYWNPEGPDWVVMHGKLATCNMTAGYDRSRRIAAFTVAELGEKLKAKAALPIWTNKDELKELAKLGVSDARAQEMVSQGNGLRYWDDPRETYRTIQSAHNEADARAKIFIGVLERAGGNILDGKLTIMTQDCDLLDGKMVLKKKDGDLP